MKRILTAILTFVCVVTAAQDTIQLQLPPKQVADSMISLSKEYLGYRYSYGSRGPKTFDCSGFTSFIYRQFGLTLGHSSSQQAKDGREVAGPITQLQKGDILIFGGRRNTKTIGHVGIFIELDEGGNSFSFIHAARDGVRISHLSEKYYKNRFLGARRILPDFCSLCPDSINDSENNMNGMKIEIPTLELDSTYKIILLSEDGKWVYATLDGNLVVPDSDVQIVISGDNWIQYQHSTISIPSLIHPKNSNQSTNTTTNKNITNTTEEGALYHTIEKGNTLSGIAKKYGTTVNRLCQLNGITINTTLQIGKKIRIK